MTIKTAIIGFGMSARVFHSPLIKACEEFEIKKVYSSKKEEVLSFIPQATVVTELDEIFNDKCIELIILCGPNHTHYEQTKKALLADKHVVVEKPFVAISSQGQELIKLAKQQNKVLSVFHNRRFDCDFLALKKLINEDQIGEVRLFESFYDRWRPVKRKGKWREQPGVATGILYDLGSHLIDQAVVLFGMPDALIADVIAQKKNQGIDDYFHITFQYGVNRVILRGNSFTHNPNRYKVLGTKANFIKDGLDPQAEKLDKQIDPLSDGFGIESQSQSGTLINESGRQKVISPEGRYIDYYKQLAKCILSDHEVPVSPQDALNVIRLIELSFESSEKKQWIKL